jgi:tRNA pseudouridine55 synthase
MNKQELTGPRIRPCTDSTMIQCLTDSMTRPLNAVVIIDKPSGMTSHDVVHRVRRILGQRSVGHLGTLDPMATGVLPLVLGNLTRLAQFYLHSEKTYEGVIRFGFATDTYDADGETTSAQQHVALSTADLHRLAAKFRGLIEQMPPPFSAKKINGVPAYKLARKKKDVPLKPVQVEVKELEIIKFENSCAHFRSRVASGTYLRSIAHDLGQAAGCGAHLQSLRRTAVAEFTLNDAHTFEELDQAMRGGEAALEEIFVHPRKLLPLLPSVSATDENVARIRHGQTVNLPEFSAAREVKVFGGQRGLLAIVIRIAGTLFQPRIVLS